MTNSATVNINPSVMIRASATPALTRFSSSFLLNVAVPEPETVPVNAPLEGVHNGGVYFDKTESDKLLWYVPAYSLSADPDPVFEFMATQRGADQHGNPYFVGRLTLSMKKSVPFDAQALIAKSPGVNLREIPIDGLAVSLNTTFKDNNGNDQVRSTAGTVAVGTDGVLTLTFDNIMGEAAVLLYEDLVMFGGASVVLSGNYNLWRPVAPIKSPPPPHDPDLPPIDDADVLRHRPPPFRTVATHPVFFATPVRTTEAMAISAPATIHTVAANQTLRIILEPPPRTSQNPPSQPNYQRIVTPMLVKSDLGKKYAASQYSLQFKVSDGTSTHPIVNVGDLREFNIRQSEFEQLTALGDINQRYSSISRAYIGVLSKTIVVIPSRYVITRNANTLDCVCCALLDSASSGASKCKFQFSFVIAPDISPIDLLQFSQEVASNRDLQGYSVRLPDQLKEGSSPKIQTAFQSSADCLPTNIPHALSLSISIRDDETGSPAVANANILIRQLCSDQVPFMSGSILLKLDDFYPDPVEASIILNFHQSLGDPSELSFLVNEANQSVDVANRSSFDLRFTRYALCNASGVKVIEVNQLMKKGETFHAPLPADHGSLMLLVDRQTDFPQAITKGDVQSLMRFQAQDVQNTQYMIGVNAISVKFDERSISQIDVSVLLIDLPHAAVATFSLVNLRKVNQTNVLIPIQNAISNLNAMLRFTIHHTNPQLGDAVFTLQHDFVGEPILILNDSDLNAKAH